MSSSSSPAGLASAPSVFFLQEDAPEDVSTLDICDAAELLVGFNTIFGAQRIGSVWRLCPLTREVRAKLISGKLLIKG